MATCVLNFVGLGGLLLGTAAPASFCLYPVGLCTGVRDLGLPSIATPMSTTWLEGASGRMLRPVHAHMQNKNMINVHHSRMATRQMCRWGCKADKIDWQGRLAARLARRAGICTICECALVQLNMIA